MRVSVDSQRDQPIQMDQLRARRMTHPLVPHRANLLGMGRAGVEWIQHHRLPKCHRHHHPD